MLNKLKKSNQKGFTIIEVMIVLAIAGLILLVVLLAVPALQRNSRNTTMKNDVASIAGAIGEFASNNDGAIPNVTNSTCGAGSVSLNNSTTGTASTAKVQGSTVVNCGAVANPVTPAAGAVTVQFGQKCPATLAGNATQVTTVASARSTAMIYANETSGGALQAKCTDS